MRIVLQTWLYDQQQLEAGSNYALQVFHIDEFRTKRLLNFDVTGIQLPPKPTPRTRQLPIKNSEFWAIPNAPKRRIGRKTLSVIGLHICFYSIRHHRATSEFGPRSNSYARQSANHFEFTINMTTLFSSPRTRARQNVCSAKPGCPGPSRQTD